ncbi:MAG: hypothetical protein DRG50_09265 [Deltaproteobacteria bacterium]|nr:MAG: hypothetical protein DRG50_09265 [Deltaproteobacteria bacterium]
MDKKIVRGKKQMDFNMRAILRETLRRLDLDAGMKGYAVWRIWDQVVGKTIAQQAQPAFFHRGILFVKCSSSAWIQQLQFMKGMILEGLNKRLGKKVVKEIRLQIGVVPSPSKEAEPLKGKEVTLNEGEKRRVEEALHPLKDPEVREIVRRIMVKGVCSRKKL